MNQKNRYRSLVEFYKTATNKIIKISRILPGGFDGNYSSSTSASNKLKEEVSNIFKVDSVESSENYDYIPQATEGMPYDLHLYIMDDSFLSSEKHGEFGRDAALLFVYNLLNPRIQALFERIQLRANSGNYVFSKKEFINNINNSLEILKNFSSNQNKKIEDAEGLDANYIYQLNDDQMYIVDHLISSIENSGAPFFFFLYDPESHESYGFSEIKHDIMHILKDGDVAQERPEYISMRKLKDSENISADRKKRGGTDFSNTLFRMKYWPLESFYIGMQTGLKSAISTSSGQKSMYKLIEKVVSLADNEPESFEMHKLFKDKKYRKEKISDYTKQLNSLKNKSLSDKSESLKREIIRKDRIIEKLKNIERFYEDAMRTTSFLILSSYLEGSYTSEDGREIKKSFTELFNTGHESRGGRFKIFNEDMYHDFLAEKFFAKEIGISKNKEKIRQDILNNIKNIHKSRSSLESFLTKIFSNDEYWKELDKDFSKKAELYLENINEEKRNSIYKMFFLINPSFGKNNFISINHVNFYTVNKLSNLRELYNYVINYAENNKIEDISDKKTILEEIKKQYNIIAKTNFSVNLKEEIKYVSKTVSSIKEKINEENNQIIFFKNSKTLINNIKSKTNKDESDIYFAIKNFLASNEKYSNFFKVWNQKVGSATEWKKFKLDNNIGAISQASALGFSGAVERYLCENYETMQNMISYYEENLEDHDDYRRLYFLKFYQKESEEIVDSKIEKVSELNKEIDSSISGKQAMQVLQDQIEILEEEKKKKSNPKDRNSIQGEIDKRSIAKIPANNYSFEIGSLNEKNNEIIKPFIDNCIKLFSLEGLFKLVILNRSYEDSLSTSEKDSDIYKRVKINAKIPSRREDELSFPDSKISFFEKDDYANLDVENLKKLYEKSTLEEKQKSISQNIEEIEKQIGKEIDEGNEEKADDLYDELNNLEKKLDDLEKLNDSEYKDKALKEMNRDINRLDIENKKRIFFNENYKNKIKELSDKIFIFLRIATGHERSYIDKDSPSATVRTKEKELLVDMFGKEDGPGYIQRRIDEASNNESMQPEKQEDEESQEEILIESPLDNILELSKKDTFENSYNTIKKDSFLRKNKILNIYKNIRI